MLLAVSALETASNQQRDFAEIPEEVSCDLWGTVIRQFCCFRHVPTLVSITTLQGCSDQLSSCSTGEVFAAWWEHYQIFPSPHSSPFHPLLALLIFLAFFPSPFRWPTCCCQRWLTSEHFSFTLLAYSSCPRHAHINLAHHYSLDLNLPSLLYT